MHPSGLLKDIIAQVHRVAVMLQKLQCPRRQPNLRNAHMSPSLGSSPYGHTWVWACAPVNTLETHWKVSNQIARTFVPAMAWLLRFTKHLKWASEASSCFDKLLSVLQMAAICQVASVQKLKFLPQWQQTCKTWQFLTVTTFFSADYLIGQPSCLCTKHKPVPSSVQPCNGWGIIWSDAGRMQCCLWLSIHRSCICFLVACKTIYHSWHRHGFASCNLWGQRKWTFSRHKYIVSRM